MNNVAVLDITELNVYPETTQCFDAFHPDQSVSTWMILKVEVFLSVRYHSHLPTPQTEKVSCQKFLACLTAAPRNSIKIKLFFFQNSIYHTYYTCIRNDAVPEGFS